jgi:DNA repair exonuclease SbcCD ATPase subunit
MESENPWEALRASLLEAGYSLDKIDKLESFMKKDELFPLFEKVLEKVKKLGEISSEVEKETESGEDISNRANLLFQSVKGVAISLIGDPAYMRSFLRNKGKIKEVRRILEVTLEEANSLGRELVNKVNAYIRERGLDIEELRSYEEIPAALSFLRILKRSKEAQEQKAEPKEEQRKVKEEAISSLNEAFEKLRSIEEELDLMGVRYERLSHYLELRERFIERIQGIEEGILQKYLKNITSRLAEVENDSKKLIQISQKLIDLKASIEEMKGDLLERMEGIEELRRFKEIIPYIGLDFPKIPSPSKI